MTDEERNIASWMSAMDGLVILDKQNKDLWLSKKEPREQIDVDKSNKKHIKRSLKFIKYLLRK